jgi:hypothetical protein
MIITTSLRSLATDVTRACQLAQELGAEYAPRQERPLAVMQAEYHTNLMIVFEQGQPVAYQGDNRFFFHRGMAELRILNLMRTGHDPMIKAMELSAGMSVLDCTLGLAADALVASFVAGDAGNVLGIEASPIVAALTRWGLAELQAADSDARAQTKLAAGKIRVRYARHQAVLAELPDNSFDVVYFDPMFRHPKPGSCGIQPLRDFAATDPLDIESLREALRVARLRVVVKEAQGSREFKRLEIRWISGGRYSSVQYGILLKEEQR